MSTRRKCVIWDLDNTLWTGIVLEGDVVPRPEVLAALDELRRRGIVQSIASRGDEQMALRTLQRFDLCTYFAAPRINWLPKSTNLRAIATALHLPLDAMVFVDDDAFEREQIRFMLPDVCVVDAADVAAVLALTAADAHPATAEARQRSDYYAVEQLREQAARSFATREEFLHSCAMRLTLRDADATDMPRVHELLERTHQMNSTGWRVDADSPAHLEHAPARTNLYVAQLEDRFGPSGIISTVAIRRDADQAAIICFAMSCRVMGRGVERTILATLIERLEQQGVRQVVALYRPTERNRMIRTMFQMNGFRSVASDEPGMLRFMLAAAQRPTRPSWVRVT